MRKAKEEAPFSKKKVAATAGRNPGVSPFLSSEAADIQGIQSRIASSVGNRTAQATKENELPALGRPLHLGMLYDQRSDTLIPGITLWDPETLMKHVRVKPQPKTECRILASDKYNNLAAALNLNSQLKASLLGGKVDLNGSAILLKENKKSRNQVRVILYCSITTRFEELTMRHLGTKSIAYRGVLEQGEATHVVTAVLYGAQAFFVFGREVVSCENKQNAEKELRAVVQKLSEHAMGGDGRAKIKMEGKANLENFSCTFYGDIALENNPITDSDAMRIYSDLPKLLGEKGEKAVPVKVWLYPLAKLDPRAAQMVREISTHLITRAQAAIEQLSEIQCQNLRRSMDETNFPLMTEKILHFQDLCKRYKEAFQEQLAGILPSIRGGGKEEDVLREILDRKGKSPFNSKCLTEFLKQKCAERDFVKLCCCSLKDVDIIPSEYELNEILFDQKYKFVVSFTFTSLQKEEPYLLDLEEWIHYTSDLAPPSSRYEKPQTKEWFEEEIMVKKAREYVKSFSEFARLNKQTGKTNFMASSTPDEDSDGKVCFIVSCVPDKDNPGVSIYVYEDGQLVSRNFGPLLKPLPPTIGGIGHDSVQLTFDLAAERKALLSSYCVEYRILGQETWMALDTKNDEETFLVRKLLPNTTYQFRYAVRSKIGLGKNSGESEVVETLPTSPPEEPTAVTVKRSAISVSWKIPSLVGEGVVINEYRVKYKEEAAEGSKRGRGNWKDVMVGNSVFCQVTGLRPGTPYRFQVLAVTSDGTESTPSKETVITTQWEEEKANELLSSVTESSSPKPGTTEGLSPEADVGKVRDV